MGGGAAPTGLIGWVTQYGNVVFFFAQIAFWMILSAVAVYAVLLFKRLVDAKTGDHRVAAPPTKTETVSVEQFVE